jgi:hypothetical protein
MALGGKGDQDGMTSEESEAIRLNPNNAVAHAALGIAFAGKGDRQASLEQCRIARELAPENAQVRGVCDKLAEGLKAGMTTRAMPGAAQFVAFRTDRHQKYSTEEVFENAADEIALFLKSHNVALLNDATGRTILTESTPSIFNLVSQARSAGGGSVILLTVDRPVKSWLKLQVQCYDTSGQMLWEESTADSGWGHLGAAGARSAIERMEEKLAPRVGQPGMPIKRLL